MKTRFTLVFALLCFSYSFAQVHIQIEDPETWSREELAPYVGKTVIFDDPMIITSNARGGYIISARRLFTPTNQAAPYIPIASSPVYLANASAEVTLTGVSGYHRCGERVYNLTARVVSTNSLTMVSGKWQGNQRADLLRSLPDLGDYRLLVCGFNLENYFVEHLGAAYLGANSQAAHEKQCEKVKKALVQINADIFGLVELEQGNAAIKEIVDSLNKYLQPRRNYKYFRDAQSGSGQKSDYVYDANVVEPIGTPYPIDEKKKFQCFREKETGEKFIFSINHFKAKTSGGQGGDADKHDGQGTFNERRVKEAQSVISAYKNYWINKAIRDKDLLIMGDLNAYAKEDPIMKLIDNEMIDLHRAFHEDSSYSYQFDDRAGYLDHALSNITLRAQITGVAGYHINSDEDDDYRYDGYKNDGSMFRCSDHDPVLVGLKLDSTLVYDPSPAINTAEIVSGEAETLIIRNAKKPSYYAIYTVNGLLLKREEISSNEQSVPLPIDPGVYVLYLYSEGQVFHRKVIVR